MNQLCAKNICYTYQSKYQKVEALKDITCEFEKGKLYAIVGSSGCGKTTLLSLLAGLSLPTSGAITVDGKKLESDKLEIHRRDHVSVIFQSFHLFPALTVLENVLYPMQIKKCHKKIDIEKAKNILNSVGIFEPSYKKLPVMLSGGEQQRVAIARALSSDAKFILGDEPTGNLDSENSDNVIKIFKQLVKEQYCVILVTHDLNIAKQADVVYRMKDGKLCKTDNNKGVEAT